FGGKDVAAGLVLQTDGKGGVAATTPTADGGDFALARLLNRNPLSAGIFAIGGAPRHVQGRPGRDGKLLYDFAPSRSSVTAGVTVAVGDINGDGYPDLVTGAAAGNPHVKVYDGKAVALGTFNAANPDASLLTQFFPYGLNFNIGANVAVGDVDADGFADIVT